jgi:5'-nucleotidase
MISTTFEDVLPEIKEIINSPGFFRDLPPGHIAANAVEDMLDAGHDVFICTKPHLPNPTCESEKKQWIQEHIPVLEKKIIMTQDKTMVRGDILIDDTWQHGKKHPEWDLVMFDQPWNTKYAVRRLNDWSWSSLNAQGILA